MNFAGILAACQRIGVEWYAVEQDICQRDPFESLAISYRNLPADDGFDVGIEIKAKMARRAKPAEDRISR